MNVQYYQIQRLKTFCEGEDCELGTAEDENSRYLTFESAEKPDVIEGLTIWSHFLRKRRKRRRESGGRGSGGGG